jgi:hypothetical protein
MSILHNLPLDIIHKEIFPKLDWSSRVTANVLLDPADRLSFPLKKDAGISLMMRKEHDILKKKLSLVAPYNSQYKNYTYIVDLMTAMKEITYLLQYSLNFRMTFIERCMSFGNPNSSEYATAVITDYDKMVLVSLCEENIQRIETLPFLRDVVSSCHEKWTAVSAGPPHIVEQTAYKIYNGYTHTYDEYSYDYEWEGSWSRRDD